VGAEGARKLDGRDQRLVAGFIIEINGDQNSFADIGFA
jgi:hypothetical protein